MPSLSSSHFPEDMLCIHVLEAWDDIPLNAHYGHSVCQLCLSGEKPGISCEKESSGLTGAGVNKRSNPLAT